MLPVITVDTAKAEAQDPILAKSLRRLMRLIEQVAARAENGRFATVEDAAFFARAAVTLTHYNSGGALTRDEVEACIDKYRETGAPIPAQVIDPPAPDGPRAPAHVGERCAKYHGECTHCHRGWWKCRYREERKA